MISEKIARYKLKELEQELGRILKDDSAYGIITNHLKLRDVRSKIEIMDFVLEN